MLPNAPYMKSRLGHRPWHLLLGSAATWLLLLAPGCSSEPEASSTTTSATSGNPAGGGNDTGGAGGTSGEGGADATGGAGGGGVDPDAGWTKFTESADTRKVYVSSSTGDDANDGLSPEKAKKTIAAGVPLIRDGFPDWLLLKRDDVWIGESFGRWQKSGKNAAEPILISSYGTGERPLLKVSAKEAITTYDSPNKTEPVNYIAIVGLHFYSFRRDPSSPDYDVNINPAQGIRWLTKTDGLLLEDMMIRFYATNIVVQGSADKPAKNVKVRRSVLTDAHLKSGAQSHPQGIYTDFVDGLTIEENVFDHNGWNDDVAGSEKTIYNHNMYLQVDCDNMIVRDNIIARAASHGVQVRPGGLVTGNFFIQNPIGMSFGVVRGGHAPKANGVKGEVANNVIVEGADIGPSNQQLGRGYGIEIGNIQSAVVHDNVIAHNKSASTYGQAIVLTDDIGGIGFHNLTINDNLIYDWTNGLTFSTSYKDANDQTVTLPYENVDIKKNTIQAPSLMTYLVQYNGGSVSSELSFSGGTYSSGNDPSKWFKINNASVSFTSWQQAREPDAQSTQVKYEAPDRDVGDYNQSLGGAGTFDAYIAEARKQAHGNYRYEYTAKAVSDFIRAGLKVKP